jgi:carbon-monoxide dehydrogenase small subunit
MSDHSIEVTVNGERYSAQVEARLLLSDFLRANLGFTGVHAGCEHGICGACTVMVRGAAVRSCLMLAVQADGASITSVEGLAAPGGSLHPVQQALRDTFATQCGFCTPGVVITLAALTDGDAKPSSDVLIEALSGHLCRCTGYQGMRRAARLLAGDAVDGDHA